MQDSFTSADKFKGKGKGTWTIRRSNLRTKAATSTTAFPCPDP